MSTDTARISCGNGNQGWGVLPGAAYAPLSGAGALETTRFLPAIGLMNYIAQDLLRDTQTQGSTFSDVTGPVSTPGYLCQKFVIPMIEMKYEIKNQTNTVCHVSLYDCVLRDTTTVAPNPISDVTAGLLQERTGYTAARTGIDPIGVSPFQSSLFCKKWLVVKTTTLIIPAGSTHIHTFVNRPKRMFSFDDDTSIAQTNNTGPTGQGANKAYQGYTTACTMARIWGGVADDSANLGNVFNASAAIDIVARCYLKYGQFVKNKRVHAIYSNQNPTGTAQTVLEDNDQIANVTVA